MMLIASAVPVYAAEETATESQTTVTEQTSSADQSSSAGQSADEASASASTDTTSGAATDATSGTATDTTTDATSGTATDAATDTASASTDTATDTATEAVTCSHKWGKWKVTKKATYISKGSKTRVCTECGKKQTKAIARKIVKNKWVKVNGKKYYLNKKGNVVKGWQKIRISNKKKAKVKWCYFDNKGVFRKSISKYTKKKWVTVAGKKFYFNSNRKPTEQGFRMIRGYLYYFQKDKSVAIGNFTASDGETYKSNKYGTVIGMKYYQNKYKTFILVDISDQTMKYYKAKKLAFEADVITGTKGVYDTPTGIYKINSKRSNIYLSGPSWYVKVQRWMAFIGTEFGIHDTTCRPDKQFATHTQYTISGSYGCITMKKADVRKFYSMIDTGTTLIIRK